MSLSGYLHGTYGTLGATHVSTLALASSAPLIVGTAPINLVRNWDKLDLVNKPIRLQNITAKNIIGYSDNWEDFTLCEAIKVFFDNKKGSIGPAYVINVLDPAVHKKSAATTKSLTFANGRATIESDTIIIDTFALDGKVEGTDYTLSYNFLTGRLTIASVDTKNPITGTIEASYTEVDPSAVTTDDIIGTVTPDGEYSGLQAGQLIYPYLNVITTLVAIPKYGEDPDVYQAVKEYVQGINGQWYAMGFFDLPLEDADGNAVDTIAKAIKWAGDNAYNSMYSKTFWPRFKASTGEIYHLSMLALAEQMRVDESHYGVPMETCSNESICQGAQYFGAESKNQGFDRTQANNLNAKGISTVIPLGGEWDLWGDHTAAFVAGEDGLAKSDVDALAIFDVNVRMQEYIINEFQNKWKFSIDEPMNLGLRDAILESEQQRLEGLVAMGALIGHPTVAFLETENSTRELMNGNFQWNFSDTPTPPAKALIAEVSYTDEGFSSFFGEEE